MASDCTVFSTSSTTLVLVPPLNWSFLNHCRWWWWWWWCCCRCCWWWWWWWLCWYGCRWCRCWTMCLCTYCCGLGWNPQFEFNPRPKPILGGLFSLSLFFIRPYKHSQPRSTDQPSPKESHMLSVMQNTSEHEILKLWMNPEYNPY